jgi:hypothetical protein
VKPSGSGRSTTSAASRRAAATANRAPKLLPPLCPAALKDKDIFHCLEAALGECRAYVIIPADEGAQ